MLGIIIFIITLKAFKYLFSLTKKTPKNEFTIELKNYEI